ncbi:hypothetical protein VTK26DRAFT_1608 [Humicola hyalothermophila]
MRVDAIQRMPRHGSVHEETGVMDLEHPHQTDMFCPFRDLPFQGNTLSHGRPCGKPDLAAMKLDDWICHLPMFAPPPQRELGSTAPPHRCQSYHHSTRQYTSHAIGSGEDRRVHATDDSGCI